MGPLGRKHRDSQQAEERRMGFHAVALSAIVGRIDHVAEVILAPVLVVVEGLLYFLGNIARVAQVVVRDDRREGTLREIGFAALPGLPRGALRLEVGQGCVDDRRIGDELRTPRKSR